MALYWKQVVNLGMILSVSHLLWISATAHAQIIPDGTLGDEGSRVLEDFPAPGIDIIDQGAQRGNNLFHSFEVFNINTDQSAYFLPPTSIENIFSRVTGNSPSSILGTLGVLGDANLFFLNPNGILFGPNARLDVRGSFLGTTANSFIFSNSFEFSARNPSSSLLSINVPIGLQYGAEPAGTIRTEGTLAVNPGRSLSLVGGEINSSGAAFVAPGGQVQLTSISGSGVVDLRANGRIRVPANLARSNISLLNRSFIFAEGGHISLTGRRIAVENRSIIAASTTNEFPESSLAIDASELLQVRNSFLTTIGDEGADGGDIRIISPTVRLLNGGAILANVLGSGDGGNLVINASERVELQNLGTGLTTSTFGRGDAGNITLRTPRLRLQDRALISTDTSGRGNAGDVTMEVGHLLVRGGAGVSASAFLGSQGLGGNISISATEYVRVAGAVVSSSGILNSRLLAVTGGAGDAGDLRISSPLIIVEDGARIANDSLRDPENPPPTNFRTGDAGILGIDTEQLFIRSGGAVSAGTNSSGNGGDLIINASELVSLDGVNGNTNSRLFTETQRTGNAGNLTLQTAVLRVRGGAQIRAGTGASSSGDGGQLRITATDQVQVSGTAPDNEFPSGLLTQSEGSGNAGDLTIETPRLWILDEAIVSTQTQREGRGGQLSVVANGVFLDNRSRLTAESVSTTGGSIQLRITDILQLQNRSQITASTRDGQGGNLTLNSDRPPTARVELLGNSVFSTQAVGRGNAGALELNVQDLRLQSGRIIASSTSGRSGDITLRELTRLQVEDGQISGLTASGQAGSVQIDASNAIQLRGNGGVSVEATSGGSAGNLTIGTNTLTLEDGAVVNVSSLEGAAGNLTISADRLLVDESLLTAQTGVTRGQEGANITLQNLEVLILRNGSRIVADAGTDADGGNISINSGFVIAVPREDSDIRANAIEGRGGSIDITTQGLFGIRPAPAPLERISDITASSERGVQGVVTINTPDVDPNRGLVVLASEPVRAQLDQRCQGGRQTGSSRFVETGRGGLPPAPEEIGSGSATWIDWRSPTDFANSEVLEDQAVLSAVSQSTLPSPIIEAQGWIVSANGEIVLTADAPTVLPYSSWRSPQDCQTF